MGKQAAQRKASDLLAQVLAMPVSVAALPLEAVRRKALRHWQRRQEQRQGFSDGVPTGEATVQRLMVNYLRHERTTYDRTLEAMLGKADAIDALRQRVYSAIGAVYPELSYECDRQQQQRR